MHFYLASVLSDTAGPEDHSDQRFQVEGAGAERAGTGSMAAAAVYLETAEVKMTA